MSGYTIAQLNELIRLAKRLGFQDDVAYWEAEKRSITDRTIGASDD